MTPTVSRSDVPVRRTQTRGSTHHAQSTPCCVLPGCMNNSTEEAMPDPDAGPSHEPGARILGGRS